MFKRSLILTAFLAVVVCSAVADAATYDITVNTSSIFGTVGSLDFNFDPGPLVTQPANLQILNFSSDGALAGSPVLTGDVSGALAGTVTFDNATVFNDYFEGFTFGNSISFDVRLYGPALTSPGGTSDSVFAYSMFSDAAGTIPTLTSDTTEGYAVTVDVNLDGTTTPTNFSAETTATVPEPSTLLLLGLGLGLVGFVRTALPQ